MTNGFNSRFQKNPRAVKPDNLELENSTSLRGTITSFAKDTGRAVGQGFADIGKGIFNDLIGQESEQSENSGKNNDQKSPELKVEGGRNLFNYRSIEEDRQMNELKGLIEEIKNEIEMIKHADSSLSEEVKDIEKVTLQSVPEKTGIYHIRILEVFLKILRQIRLKIGESRTWMEALVTKKAKRGSAFAVNTKKKGTSYSLSQEISNARSVQ